MTQNSNAWTTYRDRIDRVSDYIYEHLDEKIDLLTLADVACMSPYHWHRVYRAVLGESVASTVKRLRLHRAAGLLAMTAQGIDKVAKTSGYRSLQSFTRIFAAAYGMPPAEYRKRGLHSEFSKNKTQPESRSFSVELRSIAAMDLVAVEHRGSYMRIDQAFGRLFAWLGERRLLSERMRLVGVYFDDASIVKEKELRSLAGIVLPAGSIAGLRRLSEYPVQSEHPDVSNAAGPDRTDNPSETLFLHRIPEGLHAVLSYKGPYASMHAAYRWLYGTWLTGSGLDTGGAPVFEEYLNNPRDTVPRDLRTDICLPVKTP